MSLRKARTMEELLHDQGFPYHIGQLIGASEMISHWLEMQDDEDTKSMGAKLAQSVDWFFKDTKGRARETIQNP